MKKTIKIIASLGLLFLSTGCAEWFKGTGGPKKESGQTFVTLRAQPIVQGFRPYTGHWGPINGAYIERIELTKAFSGNTLFLVKAGYSTANCNDPKAFVALQRGDVTTSAQLKELFLTTRPSGKVPFVACLSTNNNAQIDSTLIKIYWRRPAENSLVSSALTTQSSMALSTVQQPSIAGSGGCLNSRNKQPKIENGRFVCDLEAQTTTLTGLGIVDQVVRDVEVSTSIDWDIFELLSLAKDDGLEFPEISFNFKANSPTDKSFSGVITARPKIIYDGPDLCQVTISAVDINTQSIDSPDISSFVATTLINAVESNSAINELLVRSVGSGFIEYVSEFLPCEESK